MASRFPSENQAQLRPRKGHNMKWSCDKHAEPISFYCKKHDVPICHRCATKDHGQKPCELDDIEDVILERMRRLVDKQQEIEETKKQLKKLDSKIESSATSASNHLQIVNDEVRSTHKDESKSVNDDEEKKIRLINEEADEEIRIINMKRDRRIKGCNAEKEKQQLIIEESQAKLLSETKAISKVVSKKITDLQSKNQHAIGTFDNIDATIKRIKQDDKTLVNEAPQVLASIDNNLNLNIHQDVSECLDRIQCEVQKVKFVEGEVGGEHFRRIDGYIGKWELVKSIHIPSTDGYLWMRGLISDDEICVADNKNNMSVINISTEHTKKVIEGDRNVCITSCAPIDSNVIVCGKRRRDCKGDSVDGCITLYDRQWKVIRDISIPGNNCYSDTSVYVDVDRDGMILAAQEGKSNIYVINPADGKIVITITIQGKVVYGKIQALSSGDIVVNTLNEFTVISRSGEEKAVIHSDDWVCSWLHFDKLTNTLYITHSDVESRTFYTVDQVSCNGIIEERNIVQYEKSVRCVYTIDPCLVTPSGNLVACEGDKLFVYKKRFIV